MLAKVRGQSPRNVVVLYNTDYDEELIAATDASAVRISSQAITQAIRDHGIDAELLGVHGLDLGQVMSDLRTRAPDLVFNLCESLCGDARNEIIVPSVLEMLDLPYTGTGALSLGLCLHKDRCKEILIAHGIATPEYTVVRQPRDLDDPALEHLDYPFFVKLCHEDASVGIDERNLVAGARELAEQAHRLMAEYRQPIIAERYISGREVNVTVLGNGAHVSCLPLFEIDFSAMPEERPHIVSYAAKWDEHHIDYAGTKPVPVRAVAPALAATIEQIAMDAYRALGLRDFGRVDVRVDAHGQPFVIDVNPNCDLSPDAGVARAAAYAGMDYPALIGRVCETAWSRHHPQG
jgi:D-alanine-D-alanine ligase